MVMGFIRPSRGSVAIEGHDLSRSRETALASVGGLVEGSAFYPYLSGRRNLEMVAAIRGLPPGRVDEVLELVRMGRASLRPFGAYSQGMRQRLGVAAALLHRPRLVVLDEPTSGLDPAGTREMRSLLPQLARDGAAVVLSSHLLSEVQQVCQRVAIMQAGRIVAAGAVESLLRRDERWRIRVSPEALGEAQRVLSNLPGAPVVECDGSDLRLKTSLGGADLNAALFHAGVVASELERELPTLEAVFMDLTAEDEIR